MYAVSCPSGVWSGAAAEIEFFAFWPLNQTSGGIKFTIFLRIDYSHSLSGVRLNLGA